MYHKDSLVHAGKSKTQLDSKSVTLCTEIVKWNATDCFPWNDYKIFPKNWALIML